MNEIVDMLLQRREMRISFVGSEKGKYEYTRYDCLMILKRYQLLPGNRYAACIARDISARNELQVRDEEIVQTNLEFTQFDYEIYPEDFLQMMDVFEAYDLVQKDENDNISLTETGIKALNQATIRKDAEEYGDAQ